MYITRHYPYNPCSGNNTIIVFPKKKSIAFIAPSVYALLQKMITKSAITTKPNKNYIYKS